MKSCRWKPWRAGAAVLAALVAGCGTSAGSDGFNASPEPVLPQDNSRPETTALIAAAPALLLASGAGSSAAGSAVETSYYRIAIETPRLAAKGKTETVRVVVVPKKGWKLNQEFPTKLTVSSPEGVTVQRPTQKRQDAAQFSEKGATFHIDFTSATAGVKSFAASFKFAVCTETTCDPKKEELAWVVVVK